MTTAAADAPAPATTPKLSDEKRLTLINGVEKMIHRQISRSLIPARDWDDAAAQCVLMLWEASAKFDPNGSAKFSTFARYVIDRAVLRYLDANRKHLPEAGGRVSSGTEAGYFDVHPTSQPSPDHVAADREPCVIRDDDAQAGEIDRAVRKSLFAETLAILTPSQRSLIEMIAFEGLTLDQVAEQRGHPFKVVRTNLVNAMRTLAAAGKVPAEFAAAVGLDVKEMVARAPGQVRAKDIKARRELVGECLALGWSDERIAAELGFPVGTIGRDVTTIRKKAAATKEAERVFWEQQRTAKSRTAPIAS